MNRVKWLDIAKGMGMLLVVMGHVLTTPVREASDAGMYLYTLIYYFHMPFMFYLSGVSYRLAADRYGQMQWQDFFKKKFLKLMIPYFLYNIFVYVVFAAANMIGALANVLSGAGYGKMSVGTFVYGMVKGDNPYSFHMWYIYGIMIVTVVVFIADRLAQSTGKNVLVAVACVAVCFAAVIARFYFNTAGFGVMNEVMEFALWFMLGRYLDTKKLVKHVAGYVFMGLCTVYMLVSVFAHDTLYGAVNYRVLDIVYTVSRFGVLLLTVRIAFVIADSVKENNIFRRFFDYTGGNSFYIYMFHQPFFGSGVGMVVMMVTHSPLIAVAISFVLCYLAPLMIIKVMKRG